MGALEKNSEHWIWELFEVGFSVIPLNSPHTEPTEWFIQNRAGGNYEEAKEKWPKTPIEAWKEYQEKPAAASQVEWWLKKYNGANWAIVTGYRVVVIDADSKESVEFISNHVTRTPFQVSTSKGRHFYYQVNPQLEIKNSVDAKTKIDFRGVGGYVVAPGSVHSSGAVYERVVMLDYPFTEINDLPALTLEDLATIENYNQHLDIAENSGNLPFTASPPKAQLAPVEKGGRNNAAASLAGQYIKKGVSLKEVKTILDAWNQENIPPLSQTELNTTLASIAAKHVNEKNEIVYLLEQPKKKSKILRVTDWMSIKPTPWLVDGWLVKNNVASIFGPSFTGKTFLAIDLALHVASGKPWHGRQICAPGPVVYIAGEGCFGLRKRVAAWKIHHNYFEHTHLYPTDGSIALNEPGAAKALLEEIKELAAELQTMPVLIVVDTLARNNSSDENSTKDMSAFVAALDAMRELTGACILVIHHTSKIDPNKPRGSTVFPSAVDTDIMVSISGGLMTATMLKQKDGMKALPRVFKFTEYELDTETDQTELTSVIELDHDEQSIVDSANALVSKSSKKKSITTNQKIVFDLLVEYAKQLKINNPAVEKLTIERKTFYSEMKKRGIPTKKVDRFRNYAIEFNWIREVNNILDIITITI